VTERSSKQASREWSPPQRVSIDDVKDRWADGWVWDDSIVQEGPGHSVTLEIRYPLYPEECRRWIQALPIMIDRVVFDRVDRCDTGFGPGEGTLWLSDVDIVTGQSIVFPFTQGELRIETTEMSCLVSTRYSGDDMILLSVFGVELHFPAGRWFPRVGQAVPDAP
jgi:hypothetical protein